MSAAAAPPSASASASASARTGPSASAKGASDDERGWLRSRALTSGPLLVDHVARAVAWANLVASTLTLHRIHAAVYWPSAPTFLYGAPCAEWAHVVVAAQLVNLALVRALHPGVFRSLAGKLALLVNAVLLGRMANAVREALGSFADFAVPMQRDGRIARFSGARRPWLTLVMALLPLGSVNRRFKPLRITRDLRYAELDLVDADLARRNRRTPKRIRQANAYMGRGVVTKWLCVDVVASEPLPPPKSPVVVYVHGGAWSIGDKYFGGMAVVRRLASYGVVVFNANYRLAPDAAHPAQITDCKRAVAWVKRNAAKWNGDPNKVFVMGESAGGHLSALLGVTSGTTHFLPPELAALGLASSPDETRVAGCIPVCGVFDWEDTDGNSHALYPAYLDSAQPGMTPFISRFVVQKGFNPKTQPEFALASPVWHVREAVRQGVNPDVPPFMVVHGDKDELASYEDAKVFCGELQRLRRRFGTWAEGETDVMVTCPGAHHATNCYMPSPRATALADAVADFVFHHSRRIDARSGTAPLARR